LDARLHRRFATKTDSDAQTNVAAFRQTLQSLGWAEGRNIRIDTRWPIPVDVESMQGLAKDRSRYSAA